MKTYTARPSAADLRRLRNLIQLIQSPRGRDLQTRELVALGRRADKAYALTIDFDSIKELGRPVVVIRPALNRRLARELFAVLSLRERHVAGLIALGLRNREIAEQLGISLATVKDHVHHILQKSGLASRAALIAACASKRAPSRTNPSNDGLN